MPYQASKVYFDGSHYVLIPQYLCVSNRRKKAKKNKEKEDKELDNNSSEDLQEKNNYVDYTIFDLLNESEKKSENKKNEKKDNKVNKEKKSEFVVDYFEKYYKESQNLRKKSRFKYVLNLMKSHFKNNTYAEIFVKKCFAQKERNLICKRKRLCRKAFLNEFNYFATFTYDSNKLDEDSFKKSLRMYLNNASSRNGWRYIGVWERGARTNRLHFHCLLYVPDGTMPGEIVEKKDYSFSTHNLQIVHQNTFFNDKFGRTDFEKLNKEELGNAVAYLLKYIEKTGEKIVYSRKLPQYVITDVMDSDVLCETGLGDRKLVLNDNFNLFNEGEFMGNANFKNLRQMPGTNN